MASDKTQFLQLDDPNDLLFPALEICCLTRNVTALNELLATVTSQPATWNVFEALPQMLLLATQRSFPDVLNALTKWAVEHELEVDVNTLTPIAAAAWEYYRVNHKSADAKQAFRWWLHRMNFIRDMEQKVCLMICWSVNIDSLDCLRLLLVQVGGYLDLLKWDAASQAMVIEAATSSPQFIEVCEVLSSVSTHRDFIPKLLGGHLESIMGLAAQQNNLSTLYYLINLFGPGLNLTALNATLREAMIHRNLSAALLIRMRGAQPPIQGGISMDRRNIGESEFKRRAMNMLYDEAWNVMQHTGRVEVKDVFNKARMEIEEARQSMLARVQNIREESALGGEMEETFVDDEDEAHGRLDGVFSAWMKQQIDGVQPAS